jgi:hypothetical protein
MSQPSAHVVLTDLLLLAGQSGLSYCDCQNAEPLCINDGYTWDDSHRDLVRAWKSEFDMEHVLADCAAAVADPSSPLESCQLTGVVRAVRESIQNMHAFYEYKAGLMRLGPYDNDEVDEDLEDSREFYIRLLEDAVKDLRGVIACLDSAAFPLSIAAGGDANAMSDCRPPSDPSGSDPSQKQTDYYDTSSELDREKKTLLQAVNNYRWLDRYHTVFVAEFYSAHYATNECIRVTRDLLRRSTIGNLIRMSGDSQYAEALGRSRDDLRFLWQGMFNRIRQSTEVALFDIDDFMSKVTRELVAEVGSYTIACVEDYRRFFGTHGPRVWAALSSRDALGGESAVREEQAFLRYLDDWSGAVRGGLRGWAEGHKLPFVKL